MRIVLAPAGSRGDFQPLLALAVGLRDAGHDVVMLASPNFVSEVTAFGIPVHAVGFDIEVFLRETGFEASPMRATLTLFRVGRQKVVELIAEAVALAQGADLVIGSGAQIAAPTVAEAVGAPYAYVAFTPQALWSRHHPPFTFPIMGMPGFVNRLLWHGFIRLTAAVFGGPLNGQRRALGLAPVRDWYGHFFPRDATILASDPELAQPAPDSKLALPPTGAYHLRDTRPIEPALERFLARGAPPVYVGFGSMVDKRPAQTTRMIVEAARAAGTRLLLSRGWAGFGGDAAALGDDVMSTGPVSHALLFPRVSAVVHHGGAGTTAAAARAGRPQVIVPHVFDQFMWARWVHAAGLGPSPLPRSRLTAARLAERLRAVSADPKHGHAARAVAVQLEARDAIAAGVAAVEQLVSARRGIRRGSS